ncbi:hypothetical protein PMAYCL1PPCAC_06055, partial [Pristionchus mayeri]
VLLYQHAVDLLKGNHDRHRLLDSKDVEIAKRNVSSLAMGRCMLALLSECSDMPSYNIRTITNKMAELKVQGSIRDQIEQIEVALRDVEKEKLVDNQHERGCDVAPEEEGCCEAKKQLTLAKSEIALLRERLSQCTCDVRE